MYKNDGRRSIPLCSLSMIIEGSVDWISLQTEFREADLAVLRASPHIRHLEEHIQDFADTAALCEQCDLVISVDTSVAHLAGALGKPVWILLPFSADWRWLLDREDSPWYPSAKLYRQERIGDWEGALRRVKQDLQAWVAGHAKREPSGDIELRT